MKNDIATKNCKMCCTDIPKKARKCPNCQHFQSRIAMMLFHPAFAVVAAAIPMAVMIFFIASMFDEGSDFRSYQDEIEVTDSKIAFGDPKSGATVVVIGTIKNTSPLAWKDVQFHVDFFDADGEGSDVGERKQMWFYLPANGSTTFKVSFRREFPESDYVTHQVRVVLAKDARARW